MLSAMRLVKAAVLSVIAIAFLAGCTATPDADASGADTTTTSEPSPTPTIDPGPVALTKEEAGERYLGIVCQRNGAVVPYSAAFAAADEVYIGGGDPDITALKAADAELLRVTTVQVTLFDDPYYTWPEGMAKHLKKIRDTDLGLLGVFDGVTNATTYVAANDASMATVPDSALSVQEVRYQLGLSADTTASCKGYETTADALHAEMLERDEYLASFTEGE